MEFLWCGIMYVPGRTNAYLGSEPFIAELIGKLNTFSQVKEGAESFTLDIIKQGSSQTVRDVTDEGIRFRGICLLHHELKKDGAFLKPVTDCFGPRFMQFVIGTIDFLTAAARQLHADDGWPETLSEDIEDSIDLLTTDKNILCFIRPHISEPFLLDTSQAPDLIETYNQYVQ